MSDNANSQGKPAEKPFRVVLASASPRRRELLEQAGVTFTVHASEVDESLEPARGMQEARRAQGGRGRAGNPGRPRL